MKNLLIEVRDKIATYKGEEEIVCGNSDYTITFSLDEELADKDLKTARFVWKENGAVKYKEEVFSGDTVNVPVFYNISFVYVGLYAGDLVTTTPARIGCKKSISCETGTNAPPPDDTYNQIVELCAAAVAIAQSVEERANNGEFNGGNGETPDLSDYYTKAETDQSIAKVENEISILGNILTQGGIVYKAETEEAYTERVTANGLNVLDGSKAVLKKVVGSTVKTQNLFDGTLLSGYYNSADFSIEGEGSAIFRSLKITLPAGTYRIQFNVAIQFTRTILNGILSQAGSYTFSTNGGEVGVSFRTVDGTEWKDEYKVWITEGTEEKPYTPYFTGLKSASFGGIESTNADGTETATLDFPKTETPLGTTIDFEQKKITDYGYTIVLKGTEVYSNYHSNVNGIATNGVYVGVLPNAENNNQNGVTTDGIITVEQKVNRILIGAGNSILYWVGILDILGFTTAGTPATSEEAKTAIANFKAYLAKRYADGNPVTIRYVSSVLQKEESFTEGNEYTAYKSGTEKVLYNDGAEFGADNTLTQDYIVVKE